MFLLKCCVVFSLLFVILFGVFTHSFTKRLRYRPVQQKSNEQSNDVNQTPKFIRPQEAEDLECARLLDQTQAQQYATDRLTYTDPPWPDDLPTDCHSINKRNYFQRSHLHAEERDFPLAFARAVYKDYRFLEMELAANYKPQNVYCYVLDLKSSKTFHSRMNNLAACFPNVFVARRSFLMDSTGKNMNYAFFECLNVLQRFHWRYAILLQNHDVALKTNEELVRIFKWLNGTNDISSIEAPIKRIQTGINYSFKALKLFNNQSRNTRPHNHYPPIVQFAKSLAQVSVSRAAVDFMLNNLNLDRLLSAIEWNTYGTDELLMGTLNSHDAVDLPGGFTLQCLKRGFQTGSFTRLSYWQRNPSKCHSKMFRHRICIFGMEDLLSLSNTPYLFANKMMPSSDFGAIVCWHEVLYNRTVYNRGTFRLDRSTYLEMPQVRFNRQRSELGVEFRANKFRCGRETDTRVLFDGQSLSTEIASLSSRRRWAGLSVYVHGILKRRVRFYFLSILRRLKSDETSFKVLTSGMCKFSVVNSSCQYLQVLFVLLIHFTIQSYGFPFEMTNNGYFEYIKRGAGDSCGCNLGCYYSSMTACANCCSLGI